MAAVARMPLGTASALEFLGPLGVAVARGGRRSLLWPGLAAAGVLLLTHPWQGGASLAGIACALGAAICWAAYIILTQAVGDEVAGLQGLAVSITVAALASTLVSGPAVIGVLTPRLLLAGFGLALLLPVVPFSLEMYALRRLTTSAFGTLMCLEPALAVVAGFALLGQVPEAWSLAGVAFVIAAGLGAQRSGARTVPRTAVTEVAGGLAAMRHGRAVDDAARLRLSGDAAVAAQAGVGCAGRAGSPPLVERHQARADHLQAIEEPGHRGPVPGCDRQR
jgi:inner membrane transporter RhtA